MRLLQYLVMILCALGGVCAMRRSREYAREAVRQAESLTGRRFDERIYRVGFFAVGFMGAVGSLVTLFGMFFGLIEVP